MPQMVLPNAVAGAPVFNQGLQVPSGQQITGAGGINLTGAATIGGLITANGGVTVPSGQQYTGAGSINVSGAASIGGALSANGGVTIPSGQTLNGAGGINITGTATIGGLITASKGIQLDQVSSALATTYNTTSTTPVSTGLGVSLAPGSTRVLLESALTVAQNTANDGVTVAIYRSTSAIPAAGSAPGGTDTLLWQDTWTAAIANGQEILSAILLDTGRTAGTTYYYYVAIAAVTGGQASLVGGNNASSITARTT